ncbi:AI-2E family transporter [Arsukibacterium sp.]|uniref:AI-2E family transporter n=1 Tax=Arsukibacterium sp. TaxID=1977258 RepID=UPI002FDA6753
MPYDMKDIPVGRAKFAGEQRLFNAVELRLFRYTAVLLFMVLLTLLLGIIAWSFGWLLSVFNHLLLSLSLAGILALVLHPVVQCLTVRLHLPRILAIIIVLLLFFVGISSLFVFLVPMMVNQALQLMTTLPDTLAHWQQVFSSNFPEISKMLADNMPGKAGESSKSVMPDLEHTSKNVMSYLGVLAGIGFVPLFLFFALLSGHLLRGQLTELFTVFQRSTRQKLLYFIDVFIGYVSAFFQGQLIIAMCMGILYALSFSLIGLQYGVLIGLVLGLLNIIPFLGSLIGLLVVLPMALLQPDGGLPLLLLAALVFAIVQVVESVLLTPKIMANHSGLHPALVVISLFFWGTVLWGITGMVLAVPLTAFFVAIWREIKASMRYMLNPSDVHSGR